MQLPLVYVQGLEMASSTVKIRLKDGNREFEGEGSLADIESLLTKLWFSKSESSNADSPSEFSSKPSSRRPDRSKRTVKQEDEGESSFDANEFANNLKNDELFPKIEKHIINVPGNILTKVTLVLWRAGVHLTSGQIHKALTLLRVKTDLPAVSNCISKNSKKFILSKPRTNGGPPSQYGLSAPALSEFKSYIDNLS